MATSTSHPTTNKLHAAYARFAQRMLLDGLTAQQQFAHEAVDLWCDFLKPPIGPETIDPRTAPGAGSTELMWGTLQRGLRYAGGMTAAAIDAETTFNAKLQEALGDWQSECSRETNGRFPGIDFARDFGKRAAGGA